jgi:hypothetical protein
MTADVDWGNGNPEVDAWVRDWDASTPPLTPGKCAEINAIFNRAAARRAAEATQ